MRNNTSLHQVSLGGSVCVVLFAATSVAWSLGLTTVAQPSHITLSSFDPTLNDQAVLAGGINPDGTLSFLLSYNGTIVDSEFFGVNGNGTYTTPFGYTLPTTGTVDGTYTWKAFYSNDPNNVAAPSPAEAVVVSAASPSLSTTASSGSLPGSTLTDTADLSGGYFPTGDITFRLIAPGGSVLDTELVTVFGNGIYKTPTGFPTTGLVTGTYFWAVSYSGDGNNIAEARTETVTVGATPLPATLPLFASGLGALGLLGWRRKRKAQA